MAPETPIDLKEIVSFMAPNKRMDLKAFAIGNVLCLTGNPEGVQAILKDEDMLRAILFLTSDPMESIAKDAILALINVTADDRGSMKLHEASKGKFDIFHVAFKSILDPESALADPWCMVVNNMTRVVQLVDDVLDELLKDDKTLMQVAKAYTAIEYNKKKAKLNYVATILCNLTQTRRGRKIFVEERYNFLERIIPFVSFQESIVRRGGSVGILKNLCFDPEFHDTILHEDENFLHCLLYPLAGPEEFSDEDNDTLPIELQYLPEDKRREEDPDVRTMLLESLLQLCATRKNREFLRAKGTYLILREYHKWEAKNGDSPQTLLALENVIDILIRTEEEIGVDNLKGVEVPEDMSKKFIEDDATLLQEDKKVEEVQKEKAVVPSS